MLKVFIEQIRLNYASAKRNKKKKKTSKMWYLFYYKIKKKLSHFV